MKNYTHEIYNQALRDADFSDYSEYDDVDQAYGDFVDKITKVIDEIAPMKIISVKGNTKLSKAEINYLENSKKLDFVVIMKNIRKYEIMYNT